MKRNEKSKVSKWMIGVLALAAFFVALLVVARPDAAQAKDAVIKKSFKAGKKDDSVKLTKENNTVVYEIEVPKDDAELSVDVSIGKVSDRLIFLFYYDSEKNTPIYREEVNPDENGKISMVRYFSVLKKGKYFVSISGAGTNSTTGIIKLSTDVNYFEMNDKEKDDSYKEARKIPLDGTVFLGYLGSLKEYGLDYDDTDWYTFTTKTDGVFIYGEVIDNIYERITMELYDGSGSTPELLYTYSLSEPQEKLLRTLPAGKYYIKMSGLSSITVGGFWSNQALYYVMVAPYKEMKSFSLSDSKLTLTTKGSSSKAEITIKNNPTDAIPRKVTWKSSNTKIATVENGIVKGKKKGTATITCKVTDLFGNTMTRKCKVTVEKK